MTEVINNGGFEQGLTGWSGPNPNPNPWTVEVTNPHTGMHSAFNPAPESALGQPTLVQSFDPLPVEQIKSAGFWYFNHGGSGTVGMATLLSFSDGSWFQDTLWAADPAYIIDQWNFRNWMPALAANPDRKSTRLNSSHS